MKGQVAGSLLSLLPKVKSAARAPPAPVRHQQPPNWSIPSSTQPFIIIIQFLKHPLLTPLNPVSLPLFAEARLRIIV